MVVIQWNGSILARIYTVSNVEPGKRCPPEICCLDQTAICSLSPIILQNIPELSIKWHHLYGLPQSMKLLTLFGDTEMRNALYSTGLVQKAHASRGKARWMTRRLWWHKHPPLSCLLFLLISRLNAHVKTARGYY